METLLDSSSPRRGSLNSLHRQSSGSSFSHNSKLASPGSAGSGGTAASNTTTITNNNNCLAPNGQLNPNLSKDLDKFTRYFIIKTVQVIVQSRIGNNGSLNSNINLKKVRTECKPSGNDWFNINISDIPEVSDRTKAALDIDTFSVKSNWRVCCEISLRTNDGSRVVLEHWIISNKSKTNQSPSAQLISSTKLSTVNNQISPRSPQNNRSSPIQLSSGNIGINSPLSAINSTQQSPTRIRTATFSNTMRTRLNSIDDCSGDKNYSVNKHISGSNNENLDFKASKSCYSLSNSPATNQNSDQTILASPSINSLPYNNTATSQLSSNNAATTTTTNNNNNTTNTNSQNQGYKPNAVSSIYTIYNRMSLLLKTIMTTTHIVPAYRLASRTSSQSDSCVICYRVYNSPSYQSVNRHNSLTNRGSIEDISSESPNKRSSSSSSSYDSLNIRDFVSADELEHFCPILKLGSIKTELNDLDVSVCYRTDVKNSSQLLKSPRLRDMYNKILDEDCIIAAKQLLAGNELNAKQNNHNEIDDSSYDSNNHHQPHCQEALNYLDQPLRPPFAASEARNETSPPDPSLELVESAFDGLLQIDNTNPIEDCDNSNCKTIKNGLNGNNNNNNNDNYNNNNVIDKDKSPLKKQSEPIQVPNVANRAKHSELSSGSTPKSLTDSYVFVDLNPPFASEEQNDISSFFHGPSPAFSNGFDSLKDVDELTNQLADIEANASQLDEFVDNICMTEEEEEKEEN